MGVAADDERLGDRGDDCSQALVGNERGDDLVLVARRAVAREGVTEAIDGVVGGGGETGEEAPVGAVELPRRPGELLAVQGQPCRIEGPAVEG